jgi:hypothetical protein
MSAEAVAPATTAATARALRQTGAAITALASAFDGEDAHWRPGKGGWSALEVINHLVGEEVEDFRARLRMTLADPEAEWPGIDSEGFATDPPHAMPELAESLSRFSSQRRESIAWLEGLGEVDLGRTHRHPRHGPLSAGDLLAAWVAHDLLHLRQLARLHLELLAERAGERAGAYAGG